MTSITQSSTRLVAFVAGVAVAASLIVGVFAAAPAQAAALTQSQISSIISLLQSFGADAATIANVQASLNGQPTSGTGGTGSTGGSASCSVSWTQDLQQGSTGAGVMALQKILNMWPDTMVAASGAGSPGNETSTFGPATKAAVIKFQTKYGVTPAAGYFGAKSRAQLMTICSGTTGPTTPTGPGLSVSAGAQPANALAPSSASRVPFTTFTLTNNTGMVQTINGVTVERTGLSVDANFSGIVLIDSNNNIQLGTSKTLNSNHQATIGDTFTINPGQTMSLTVAGNISNSPTASPAGNAQSGQIVSLKVVAVNTSAPVSGSLPIMGASHTINTTLTLGSVSTSSSSFDPGSTQNKNIGDTGVRFAGIRFTAGSAEDLKLYSIRWRQVGSASSVDLANVQTNLNGTMYPATVDSTGKYYTTTFPGGIMIAKGNTVDLYVQGDLVGGNSVSRTIDFDVDRGTDVYFVGQTYGYGVAVSGTYTPWYNGYAVTIQGGTATTISRATEVASQNVAVNVQGQPLGGFVTDFRGEAVSVQSIPVNFSFSTQGATGNLLTNVSLVNENGAVVAGPTDAQVVAGTQQTITFSDTVTFPTGRHVYTIKGKLASGVSDGQTITASTTPSSWGSATGQTSGNSITIAQGNFSMNSMTVRGASLAIALSSTPASQTITAGAQSVTFAMPQLDASQSGEDIRLSALPLRLTQTAGAATDLSSCQLWDGSTALNTGSNVPSSLNIAASAANNFVFDNSLTITKGAVKTLTLKCNVSSASTGNYTWSLSGSDTYNSTGFTSGNSIGESITAGSAGTMAIGNASLAVSVDSSSPSYVLASGGTAGVTIGAIKLRATNDSATLTKLGLKTSNGSTNSVVNVGTVWIYDGATQVGSVTFTGNSAFATSSVLSVVLPKDQDKVLTLKADLTDIGSGQAGIEGALVKVDPSSAEAQSNSGLINVGATAGVAGVRVFNTFPTIALDNGGISGLAGGELIRFKVTADQKDNVSVSKFAFTIASTSGVTITNLQLFAYDNSSYSGTGISGQNTGGQIGTTTANITSGATLTVLPHASNPVTIPAGQTRYFVLKASVSGVVSGSSVTTILLGDASPSPTDGATFFSAVTGNLIWSANASTTAATSTTADWSNAYGVAGLSSSGLISTRSQ